SLISEYVKVIHWSAPLSLDSSGGGFDHGSGGLMLELVWAQIAQGRMQASGVVDLLDEAGQSGGDLLEGRVIRDVDVLDLEGLEEALGLGVVVRVAAAAHRADEAMRREQGAVLCGGVLRAAIGVEDAAGPGATPRDRALKRRRH